MRVHLVDGTYELFRHFYGPNPGHVDPDGIEVGAVRGVCGTVLGMLEDGATHVGVATDHVIESFRNELWPGYKTGEGVDPDLRAQFEPLEDALRALGVVVWAMVDQEADDALAAAAAVASANDEASEVVICTPDKDLAQCVGGKVVQLDNRNRQIRDADAVREKYGVAPVSIPDYLALVGDSADGFPGLPGWGAKSSATVLSRYGHIESIPGDPNSWEVSVRGAAKLAATLAEQRDLAALFKDLATLRTDAAVGAVADWEWAGPTSRWPQWCERLGAEGLRVRADRLAARRTGGSHS